MEMETKRFAIKVMYMFQIHFVYSFRSHCYKNKAFKRLYKSNKI